MGEEDAPEMPDASPRLPWEPGGVEHFDAALLGDAAYIVEEEEVSDVEMSEGSPVAPSESSALPSPPSLRKRLAPVVPSDVPEEVVRAVDAVIMGGGLERLREMVSGEDGELSHFVVDVLMLTMGGVDGLDEGAGDGAVTLPSIMSSSRAAAIAAELLPYIPCGVEPSPRTRMARALLATLSSCTRNRTMCTSSGLLAILLDAAEKLFVGMGQRSKWDGAPLVQCIQMLGGHSVSVKDLHSWLLLIKKTLGTCWATSLTLALEKAVGCKEAKGPAVTFELGGEGSGLLAPAESRWPFSNGFGFATWIYVESFSDSLNTGMLQQQLQPPQPQRPGSHHRQQQPLLLAHLRERGRSTCPDFSVSSLWITMAWRPTSMASFWSWRVGLGRGRRLLCISLMNSDHSAGILLVWSTQASRPC